MFLLPWGTIDETTQLEHLDRNIACRRCFRRTPDHWRSPGQGGLRVAHPSLEAERKIANRSSARRRCTLRVMDGVAFPGLGLIVLVILVVALVAMLARR